MSIEIEDLGSLEGQFPRWPEQRTPANTYLVRGWSRKKALGKRHRFDPRRQHEYPLDELGQGFTGRRLRHGGITLTGLNKLGATFGRRRMRYGVTMAGIGEVDVSSLADLGVIVGDENTRILRSFVTLPDGPLDTKDARIWNAITFVLGPGWDKLSGPERAEEFRKRNKSRITALRHVPAPSIVRDVQDRLGVPRDSKLGTITAAAIAAKVPDWAVRDDWDRVILATVKPKKKRVKKEEPIVKKNGEVVCPAGQVLVKGVCVPEEAPVVRAGIFTPLNIVLMLAGGGVLWFAFRKKRPATATAEIEDLERGFRRSRRRRRRALMDAFLDAA